MTDDWKLVTGCLTADDSNRLSRWLPESSAMRHTVMSVWSSVIGYQFFHCGEFR